MAHFVSIFVAMSTRVNEQEIWLNAPKTRESWHFLLAF